MTYEEWEAGVPDAIRGDSVWRATAYRSGLFLADLAWHDSGVLTRDRRARDIADQLHRVACNISSNITEGYSRGTGKGRSCFHEYALGSAREGREWYFKGRHVLKPDVVTHRIDLCTEIIRLTLATVERERRSNRRVPPP